MVRRSSMQARIRSRPPQALQDSMSMPNTRLSRRAQRLEARARAPLDGSSYSTFELSVPPGACRAGVMRARRRLLGANTPFAVSDSRFSDSAGRLM